MTQDQYGQAQGTGYVVRGEVVPDDETDDRYADEAGPMTRLRKVASALRGDKPDETVPDETATPSADTTDPNGTWPNRAVEPSPVSSVSSPAAEDDAEYADATGPNDVVRVPETGDRDYWDDAGKTTTPGGAVAADETTVPPVGIMAPAGGMAATVPDTDTDTDTDVAAESVPTVPTGKHAA